MAHTITGIDLGCWSVKFTVLEAGFRRSRTIARFEELIAQDERPFAERQQEALKQGASRLPSGTTAYVALPGEMLTLRVLDLPFADARKIDQVVGYEMEGQMIHELHDVILDHAVLSARGKAAEAEQACRALVVAARIEDVRTMLAALQACNVEPRSLYAAPLLYRPLSPAVLVDELGEERVPGARVVVDIGHRRSNVCFVMGDEVVFARTLLHGGEEITKSLHRASNGTWTLEQAEQGKVQLGFVASRARPAQTSVEMRVDVVVREALQPLLRDLRQTLSSFSAKDKSPVEEILLTGGGARLTGLAGFLQDELGLVVSPLIAPAEPKESRDAETSKPAEPNDDDRFVLADAVARVGARGSREIDLRRGEFQYRASFSIVRQRAAHLLVLAASLAACAGIYATITMRRLSAEQKVLKTQFETAAKELFGNSHMEAADVSAALRRNQKDEMVSLPKATAYDLLDEISRRIPPADKVTIDIDDLDIRAKKTSIKGTIDSAAAVDEIVAKLKEIECFEEIAKGPITEVSGGAKQFSLNISSKCP